MNPRTEMNKYVLGFFYKNSVDSHTMVYIILIVSSVNTYMRGERNVKNRGIFEVIKG